MEKTLPSIELKCAYCGSGWRHLQPTLIPCTIGRKIGLVNIATPTLLHTLTKEQQEKIEIWQGPSLENRNRWKELVKRRGGNVIIAGRTTLLNLSGNHGTKEEDLQWLIAYGGYLDNGNKEECYFDDLLWLKYSKERLFDLCAKPSDISNSDIKEIFEYRLWNGYSPNLSRSIYEISYVGKKQKSTKIGNYYMCKDLSHHKLIFNINFDGSCTKEEMKKSYNTMISRSLLPVIVLDEAIGYNEQLCIRIRYLHDQSTTLWRSCYDEVSCFCILSTGFFEIR